MNRLACCTLNQYSASQTDELGTFSTRMRLGSFCPSGVESETVPEAGLFDPAQTASQVS